LPLVPATLHAPPSSLLLPYTPLFRSEPAEGAILQTSQGDLGLVAYIETVNDDGSIEISEMNRVEPYEVTERTIGAGDTGQYRYIDRKSTRLNSSHVSISYAGVCLKKR